MGHIHGGNSGKVDNSLEIYVENKCRWLLLHALYCEAFVEPIPLLDDAGVGDSMVYATILGKCIPEQRNHIGVRADVTVLEVYIRAFDLRYQCLAGGLVDISEHNFSTKCTELFDSCCTNTGRTS